MTVRLGEVVPDFSLPDARGTLVQVPAASTSVVYFTSNRCPSAIGWQQRIADVAADYESSGVTVIAVNVPLQFPGDTSRHSSFGDGIEGVRAVAGRSEWAGIVYLDGTDLAAAREWGAQVTPDVFVVDSDRRLRYRGAPDDSPLQPEHGAQWLRDALDAVLAGRAVDFVPTNLVGGAIRFRTA